MLENELLTLGRRHNTLTPIRRLPAEVMELVFLRTILDSEERPVSHLHRLAQVSEHWWKLIRGSSLLWTVVPLNCPHRDFSWAISKSRGAPLRITCGLYDAQGRFTGHGPECENTAQVVLDTVDRWKFVTLCGHGFASIKPILEAQQHPVLQHLCINDTAVEVDISRIRTLGIRFLDVRASKVVGLVGNFPAVTFLRLAACVAEVDDLLQLPLLCPDARYVELEGFAVQVGSGEAVWPNWPILGRAMDSSGDGKRTTKVQSLILKYAPALLVKTLLEAIPIGQLHRIHLERPLPSLELPTEFSECLINLIGSVRETPHLFSGHDRRLLVDPCTGFIRLTSGSNVTIALQNQIIMDHWLLQPTRPAIIDETRLQWLILTLPDKRLNDPDATLHILDLFSTARNLIISMDSGQAMFQAVDVLQALSSSDSTGSWYLPLLHRIHLEIQGPDSGAEAHLTKVMQNVIWNRRLESSPTPPVHPILASIKTKRTWWKDIVDWNKQLDSYQVLA